MLNKYHFHIICKMKKVNIFILPTVAILSLAVFIGCKKGEPINQANLAAYKFTTYTIDTFQLKIIFNGNVLTDTLRTPVGVANFTIPFIDTIGTLQVVDAITGQQYVDTILALRPGSTSISIVQFASGDDLILPSIPNEPAPAPGNYKVRFQYTQPSPGVPFVDSIQCVIRLSGVPQDTVVLSQNETTRFYEATLGANYSMKIFDAYTGQLIDANTNNLNSNNGFTNFNTAIIYASSPSNYLLKRIY